MAYRIMWHTGWKHNMFSDTYDTKAEAKRVATWKIKHMYLDDVTVASEDENGNVIPLLKRRRIMKDAKPFYGEWEEL